MGAVFKKKKKKKFLTKKIAAKEAASKALGTGMTNGIQFNNFEINHDIYGKPILKCLKTAYILIKKMNVKNIYLSLTDEDKYVLALVIFEN